MGNQTAAFWSPRQSRGLATHRNDLYAAVGHPFGYEAGHAADGIAEVLDVFFPRRVVWGWASIDAGAPALLECTDRPERWLITPADGGTHVAAGPDLPDARAGSAAAQVRGPAAGLLLALWKRQAPAAAGLPVDGDADLAARFLASRLTP